MGRGRGDDTIKVITIGNKEYPKTLTKIKDPPLCLYTKGNIELLNTYGIAIIGSRKCSKQGVMLAKKYAKELAVHGITIISGLAEGIDTAAHKGALEVGGNTIAVLGNGFNHIFPKMNQDLFNKIVQNGLAITEYLPNEEAKSEYFLQRNRIVSGLSLGVLIIEAKYRSGTSVTAKLAKEQGKEIFCVPHAINDRNGVGTNRLIKNGAKLVTETRDIIEEISFLKYDEEKIESLKTKKPIVKPEYQKIFNVIGIEPIEIEEICHKTKTSLQEVNQILLMLELEGYITKTKGGYKCILTR